MPLKQLNAKAFNKAQATEGKSIKVVRDNQFYAKEFFFDRMYAKDDPDKVKDKIQWIFHDFSEKMPKSEKPKGGKGYAMSKETFEQCGIGGAFSECMSKGKYSEALPFLQLKLVNAIKTPTKEAVRNIVAHSVLGKLDPGDVGDYLQQVEDRRAQIIKSQNSASWMAGEAKEYIVDKVCAL